MSNIVEYILNIYSLWLKSTLHRVVSYATLANIMQNYGCIMHRVYNCPMEFWFNWKHTKSAYTFEFVYSAVLSRLVLFRCIFNMEQRSWVQIRMYTLGNGTSTIFLNIMYHFPPYLVTEAYGYPVLENIAWVIALGLILI